LRLEGLDKLKTIHAIGTRTRDLPACSIVPQPTTLPRAPIYLQVHYRKKLSNPNVPAVTVMHLTVGWKGASEFDNYNISRMILITSA
jgi:hypothetical protein